MKNTLFCVLSACVLLPAIVTAFTENNGVFTTNGSRDDVQAAINAASDGETVTIPAGNFSWGQKITISGKAITLRGAGGGGIFARSETTVTVGTGAKVFTIDGQGKYDSFMGVPEFTEGETLRIQFADGLTSTWMEGTVTSYVYPALHMNITATSGSGTEDFWLVTREPVTTITKAVDLGTQVGLIGVTGDDNGNVRIEDLAFRRTVGKAEYLEVGGLTQEPVVVSRCWFRVDTSGKSTIWRTNRGLMHHCSWDAGFNKSRGTSDAQATSVFNQGNDSSWTTPSTMGMDDADGKGNVYFEDCYSFGLRHNFIDTDDNGRSVVRYCVMDHSSVGGGHGQDSSQDGLRHLQVYRNALVFKDESPNGTFDISNGWFSPRGGTGIFALNYVEDIRSQDTGDKGELLFQLMIVRRNAGVHGCWGAATPGETVYPATEYPAPRQIGYGYVDGSGPTYSPGGYGGDYEPYYIWGNTGDPFSIGLSDWWQDECGGGDSVSAYIRIDSDTDGIPEGEIITGEAKPGWVQYTYPHPLSQAAPADQPPAILVDPQALDKTEGENATFTISVSGTPPLTYQWQKNATNIPGATSPSFTIPAVTLADAGSYRCVVTNSYGFAVSSAAQLTVSPPSPPTIVSNPQNLITTEGNPATFSVTADGTPPLSYQWQKDLIDISGATASDFTIPSVTLADAGNYRCVVSNASGAVASSAALLTVSAPVPTPPTIVAQPQDIARAVGTLAIFSVGADGTGPLSYQWQKDLVNITGATDASLTLASVAETDAGEYRCVVSNAQGQAFSAAATLTVVPPGQATQYYVDVASGNDSNPGTPASPWRRCPGMVGWSGSAVLEPGDEVYFNRAGTWEIGASTGSNSGLDLKAGVHYIGDQWDPGAVGSRKAILRAVGRHPGGVVRFWEDHETIPTWFEGFEVDGNGQRANLIDLNHSFWRTGLTDGVKRIENCVAHGNSGNGSEGDYKFGIIVSDHSPDGSGEVANVEILDTVVFDVPRDGICVYPGSNGRVSNVLIRGCEVHSTGSDPSFSGGDGILLSGDVRNAVIEYCYSHDGNASAVSVSGQDSGGGLAPVNSVVRFCILHTTAASPAVRVHGPGSKSLGIVGNIVLENESGGGLSFAGNSGELDARVFNNLFFDSYVDLGNSSSTGSIEFRNNIIYELDDVPLTDSSSLISTHSNNHLYRANGGTLVRVGGQDYSVAGVQTWEPTVLTSDPNFKNVQDLPFGFLTLSDGTIGPNRSGLSLSRDSSALTSGAVLDQAYAGSIISSHSRTLGSSWDRGPYQTYPVEGDPSSQQGP